MAEPVTHRSYRAVVAAFSDPALAVPGASSRADGSPFDWLRTSVSRFSNGDDHARRRAFVEADLAALQPEALRHEARELTHAVIDAEPVRFDLMASVALVVPVTVLAGGLGMEAGSRPGAVDAVSRVAAGYRDLDAAPVRAAADGAVDELVQRFGGERTEATANRIGLLVQAFDASAGLIGNAASVVLRLPAAARAVASIDALVAEVLRFDPPVLLTRRVAIDGESVVLDIAAANRDPGHYPDPHRFEPARQTRSLTFGAGLRPCPGESLAIAIAAGVLEALVGHVGDNYDVSPALDAPGCVAVSSK